MKNLNLQLFALLLFFISMPSCMLLKGPASTNDYEKFPTTQIDKSSNPFQFKEAIGNIKLPDSIYAKGGRVTFKEAYAESNTYAFLILKNDTIVYEHYDNEKEASSIVTSFSVAKSFVSALVGIAIEEGHINNIQDKVVDYISNLDQVAFKDLTIEQLLNMESGIKFRENYVLGVQIGRYYHGKNIKKQIPKLNKSKKVEEDDGYKSINTLLLGLILEKATGQSLSQYMQTKLWQPLGTQYPAGWSIDSEKNKTEKSFCCLQARARDFAKFGCLYLNEGEWNGQQIISKDWISNTTFPLWEKWNEMQFGGFNGWYHNHWQNFMRIAPFEANILPSDESYRLLTKDLQATDDTNEAQFIAKTSNINFAAVGHLGQYIYVVPSKNLVMVRFGKNEKNIWWPGLFEDIAVMN